MRAVKAVTDKNSICTFDRALACEVYTVVAKREGYIVNPKSQTFELSTGLAGVDFTGALQP